MLFCNTCKYEYRDGFTVCSTCGEPLTDCSPQKDNKNEDTDSRYTPTFLCSLNDGVETDIVISLLECNDIPVMKKRHGSGEYLKISTGMSFQGVNLYVPSELLNKAQELLSATPVLEQDENCNVEAQAFDNEDGYDLQDDLDDRDTSNRQLMIWLLIRIPCLIFLVLLIHQLI